MRTELLGVNIQQIDEGMQTAQEEEAIQQFLRGEKVSEHNLVGSFLAPSELIDLIAQGKVTSISRLNDWGEEITEIQRICVEQYVEPRYQTEF